MGPAHNLKLALDAANVGADGTQLPLEMVVTAIQMVHAQDLGRAFRHEPREHQAGRRTQVGGHDLRALELDRPSHDGDVTVDDDVGAHAHQLGYVHETV